MSARKANVSRKTKETEISLSLNLDGSGQAKLATGVGFFDHMLEQIARHGMLDLEVRCSGDTHIDDHHTVEDVGIAFGTALAEAIGDKAGLLRYGHAYVPLDEALSRAVLDLSGRASLNFRVEFGCDKIGSFDTQLVREFFQGLANSSASTLHLDTLAGFNDHHIAETLFKAFGRALRMAVSHDPQSAGVIPSTKGVL